ncbi:uncharacterized protein EAE98_000687 [Botrytis deweyae]|uniref:Ubiquitin 3 binding protein But2 C-terminal domain-containing protein n=1 Tax=Botrytis deweyae TaxID=2478750 RepID=A0ABQ7J3D5_9HELO|nr:uncharacterized protein EAE98_000687 [Botrytis deweyae]KAF7940560.1 hypothetical protein EAE98_000687 [Botrytis deweyae]
MIKNPDSNGDEDIEIPFVKVTIPECPCEPLPKVQHGSLFGAAFNLTSSLVDGVLDDACHLVFPIDQNITSHDPLPNPIPYPEGNFALPPKGTGADCYYKGGRSAVGDVFCPGKPTVSCQGNFFAA